MRTSILTRTGLAAGACAMLVILLAAAPAYAQQGPINARVERLEAALDNKGLLDLVRQIELLQAEVRQLRGELENQVFALEQLRKSQRESYLDTDQRLGALERGGTAGAALAQAVPGVAPLPAGQLNEPPLPTLNSPASSTIAGAPASQAIAVNIAPATEPAAAPSAAPQVPAPLPAIPTAPAPASPGGAPPAPVVVGDNGLNVAVAGQQLAQTAPVVAAPAATAPVVSVTTPSIRPAAPTIDTAESEAAYREAFGMLKAGQYEESIASFNTYLTQYPQSQYADNAQYWLGEAYYVMRQFEPAIEQYQKLVNNYPDSKKQSHALLKVGYSYYELGLVEQAMAVLGDLKTRFPGSAAARLADERIQRIRAAAP